MCTSALDAATTCAQKLCMTCAASGTQLSLLLAATLGQSTGLGQRWHQARQLREQHPLHPEGALAHEEHIAELRAGRRALDALHQAPKPRGR